MDRTSRWSWSFGEPAYPDAQRTLIASLEGDLERHMRALRPARYLHSLSVAATAEQLALAYGADAFAARVAGILHDWDKVLSPEEQVERARALGISLGGVDLGLVQPLLHSLTAAAALPARYPDLPASVWQAISRHTVAAVDMSDLDMVLFVADGIEPIRRDVPAIRRVRSLVERRAPLDEVFWASFSSGVAYVIQTERYLYPGTLDIYNELVLRRARRDA